MAPKRRITDDFESRFLDLLEGTIEGIDKKVDKIGDAQDKFSKALGTVNQRLSKLEGQVFPTPTTTKQLPPWYRDPALIKLLTLIVGAIVFILVIVASLRGVKLPGVFG